MSNDSSKPNDLCTQPWRMHDVDTSFERASQVLEFWKSIGPTGWFTKDDEVDHRFAELFADLHFAAARGECQHWKDRPEAALALLVLLDQFPRNVFRGTGHAFATDPLALTVARSVIDRGLIEHIEPELRLFVCLPFVHSEDIADQDYAQALYQRYAPDSMEWAVHHRSIIVRFGRFPHRNESLGRKSTDDELAFLRDGGFNG